jgi:hypothetical protein
VMFVEVFTHLLCCFQLLGPDCIPGLLVGGEHFLNNQACSNKFFLGLSYDENMLLLGVVPLHRMAIFVRATATDQDLASRLLLQALLVDSLWTDQESHIVDTCTTR